MARQKELDVYLYQKVCTAFAEYDPEDGDKKISCAEAVEALQHTIRKIQNLPMQFPVM